MFIMAVFVLRIDRNKNRLVKSIRDHNLSIFFKFMLFASFAALVLVIGFVEAQGPLQKGSTIGLRKTQSAAAGQGKSANQISSSTLTSPFQLYSKNLKRVIYYPNWETWKKLYNKSFSPSEEGPAKHRYLLNVMGLIQQSYLDFNHHEGVTENASKNVYQQMKKNPVGSLVVVPSFELDFLKTYNKKYSSPAQKAYRKKVFEQNSQVTPGNFYWSDWTPEEFNNILPLHLLTFQYGNETKKLIARQFYQIYRQQPKPGTKFNQTLKRININLLNESQSLVELVSATRPIQQLGSKGRKIIPLQNTAQIQSFQKPYSASSSQQRNKSQNVRSQTSNKSYQGLKPIPQNRTLLPLRTIQNNTQTKPGSTIQNLIPKQYIQNQYNQQTKINTVPTIPTTPYIPPYTPPYTPQVPFTSTPQYPVPYNYQAPFNSTPYIAPSTSPYTAPFTPQYTAPYIPPYTAPYIAPSVTPSVPPYVPSPTPYVPTYIPPYNPLSSPLTPQYPAIPSTTGIQPNYFKL